METKIEIIITTNERYMFIYTSRGDVLIDSVIIPKVMGIFTKRKLIRVVIKTVRQIISDVITQLVKGG